MGLPRTVGTSEAGENRQSEPDDAAGLASIVAYLRAVVAASERLVSDADLKRGIDGALEALREHTGLDRTCLLRDAPGSRGVMLYGETRGPRLPGIRELFGDQVFRDEQFHDAMPALRMGEVHQSIHSHRPDDRADFKRVIGTRSELMLPVVVQGRFWGILGFGDDRSERTWGVGEIAALQGSASAIAAAVFRDSATTAQLQQAADLAMRDRLLAAVAHSLQALLGSEDGNFDDAVRATLGGLGEACGIHRVKVILQRPAPENGELTHFLDYEWWAPGLASQASLGLTRFPNSLITEWTNVLERGQALWYVIDDVPIQVRAAFENVGVRSVGTVPVFGAGRYLGLVAFDDCVDKRVWSSAEIDALTAAARTIGGAIHRHDMQHAMLAAATARQKAEEARLRAEQLRNLDMIEVNRLLEGVIAASRALLDDDDFDGALNRWLAFLATAVDADRATYGDFTQSPAEGSVTAVHFDWARPGMRTVVGDQVPASKDFTGWAERLSRGETIWAHRDELRDPASVRYWESTGCWTNLIVPVVVDRRTVGWLCFDFEMKREWKPALGSVLRTAADGAAAALKRRWAVQAMLAERDRRIELEHARADESARHATRAGEHAAVLAAVATTAEELLAATEPAAVLDALLARLGEAARARRAVLSRIEWTPDDTENHGLLELLAEWARPGAMRRLDQGPRKVPMERADAGWQQTFDRWATERRDVVVTEGQDEPYAGRQREIGAVWTVIYPIPVEGIVWGMLGFDFDTPSSEREEADLTALQTVASTIADALSRQLLEQRTLGAERERADALRLANNELIASMSRLVALQDLPAFMGQVLLALTRTCGARVGGLLAFDAVDGRLWMRLCVIDGEPTDIQTDPRLVLWRQPVPDVAVEEWRSNLAGQVLAYHPVPTKADGVTWPQNLQWHWEMGHRLRLHFPLNVGGQLVGIAGMLLNEGEELDAFQSQQAVVLAQQAAIAMQMERLARMVETSAVRTERERMAAEIHDNLAQSFTSIAMQSESLAGLLAGDPDKSRVLRLIERTAREGLAEARTSVLALLPADGWPGSLDQSLAALAERSSIRGGIECRFESNGIPCAMPGVVQESLLRIAQEATSNAMRHSGGMRVSIRLDYAQQRLRMAIEDDGHGLPSASGQRQTGGFGVSGMESRAATIGATLTLEPSSLGGLAVVVVAPCHGSLGRAP